MRLTGLCLLLLGSVAFLGCGTATDTTQKVTPPSATSQIKSTLETYAQSGELDSGMMVVEEEAEKLKESDPAKAETLIKGIEELKSLNDPAKIKAKAKELADSL